MEGVSRGRSGISGHLVKELAECNLIIVGSIVMLFDNSAISVFSVVRSLT